MIEINIVGAGRVASTLAAAWRSCSGITIGQIVNQTLQSSNAAVKSIGAGAAVQTFIHSEVSLNSSVQRVLLLGLPDGALATLSNDLQENIRNGGFDLVFHVSGQYGVDVLKPYDLGQKVDIATAHPVLPFADADVARQQLADSYCVISGSSMAKTTLQALFGAIGMHCLPVSDDLDRARYHTAMVVASNLSCALQYIAVNLAVDAGMEAENAQALIANLGRKMLASITSSDSIQALTGPLERGDTVAVERLLLSLQSLSAPAQNAIYGLLDTVVEMAGIKGSLTHQQQEQMREKIKAALLV